MTETLTRPLFRPQAVQSHRDRAWSGRTMRPPVSFAVLTAALTAAVVAIGGLRGHAKLCAQSDGDRLSGANARCRACHAATRRHHRLGIRCRWRHRARR